MLRKVTIVGAVLAVGLVGCQGTAYTDNTTAFKEHISQRLERVAKKLHRLERPFARDATYQTFVDKVRRELTETRRRLSMLPAPDDGHNARLRREIRRDTDDLEYRLDRVGG
jgi:hypothetical protein